MKKIVAPDVRWFETTKSSRQSQLVSTSNRKPSSGLMKIDPKRGDYIAKRCDTLSNDQLQNCERQLSLPCELFWSKIRCHKRCEETVQLVSDMWTCLNTYDWNFRQGVEDLINLVRGVKCLFNTFGDLMKVMPLLNSCLWETHWANWKQSS